MKKNNTSALKPKSAQTSKVSAPVTEKKVKAPKKESVLEVAAIDRNVAFNAPGRFKSVEYCKSVVAKVTEMPKFTVKGILITKGSHGVLANAVEADESKTVYRRQDGEKTVYGHATALAETIPEFKADILTPKELVITALKKAKVKRFRHRDTGEEVDVALLNPNTDSYFVGITLDGSKLRFINMEPAASYNRKAVQWQLIRDVADEKLIIALSNFKG